MLLVVVAASPWALLRSAEAQSDKISRLGFAFDQKAHDAAVAAEQNATAGGTLDGEPLPPGVVRLPRYIVEDQRVPIDDPDKLLTPRGRVAVAKKRHLTPMYQKTFGPLSAVLALLNNPLAGWTPNTPEAMALFWDQKQKERNQRMSELQGLSGLSEQLKKASVEPAARKPPKRAKE